MRKLERSRFIRRSLLTTAAAVLVNAATKFLRKDKADAAPAHALAPVLNTLNQTTQGVGQALHDLKPQEKPKGRIQRLSEWLGKLLGVTLKGLTVLAVFIVLVGIPYQLFFGRNDYVLEHFEVPPELEKAGYKSEVVAARLYDRISLMSRKAVTIVGNNVGAGAGATASGKGGGATFDQGVIRLPAFDLTSPKAKLDIEVPETKLTVSSLFQSVFESLGISPTRIDGEIVARGNKLALTIRIAQGSTPRALPLVEEDSGDVEALIEKGAREIYRDTKPVVLASYLYSPRPEDTDAAIGLIKDCIYQDKDPAVANLLWGIILLNQSRYDDADRKFQAARGSHPDKELGDVLTSCEARLKEARGDFEGARTTYTSALERRPTWLTITNYAGFLANRGEWGEARTQYESALRLNSKSEIAHNGLGQVLTYQGQYTEAMAEYRKAIALNPSSSLAYSNSADALLRQKNYDEAADVARKAIQVEPDSANAHNTLGYVLGSMGRYDDAIREFEESIRLNPNYVIGHVNYADALLNKKEYDAADAQVQEALKIDPKAAIVHNEMASILINQNRFDEAVKECDEALANDSIFVPASSNKAFALLYLKKYIGAVTESEGMAQTAKDSSDAHNTYGYILLNMGRYDDAIKEFEESIRLNSFNTYAYINWAQALLNQKEFERAEQKALEAVKMDAFSSDARNALGSALTGRGQYDVAMCVQRKAIGLNGLNVYAYTGMVDALLGNKDFKGAVENARAAVRLDKLSYDARTYLGSALMNAGDYAGAEKAYKEAKGLNQYNVYVYTGLVNLYVKQGKKKQAIDTAQAAVMLDPLSSDALNELGWARMNNEEFELAAKAFSDAIGRSRYNTYAWVGLSQILRGQGKCDKAEQKINEARKLEPNLKDVQDEVEAVRGCAKHQPFHHAGV
jgi:tetratricopeptide (TPR) repeat protein